MNLQSLQFKNVFYWEKNDARKNYLAEHLKFSLKHWTINYKDNANMPNIKKR